MSQINPYIENYTPKDYGGIDASKCELDCSLGVNYWHLPDEVMKRLAKIPEGEVKHYPHNQELLDDIIQALLKRYAPVAPYLKKENFHFGCGSFDLLCNINLLYANANKTIMGHAPQFTAYVDNVNCIGARHVSYNLEKEHGYAFNVDDFIAVAMKEKPNLICCENPNNPTGQALELPELQKIVDAAREINAAVVFDEAYGDYLPLSFSGVQLIEEGEKKGVDVYVTRTFSKGFGMAGMRMGYVMGPEHGIQQLKKLVTPFNCNELARQLALAMVSVTPAYLETLTSKTNAANSYLYGAIHGMGGKYQIAKTSYFTPICTLYVEDETVDLCKALAAAGIATVSCATYDNMGKNAVRMMLCDNVERLVELLNKAQI